MTQHNHDHMHDLEQRIGEHARRVSLVHLALFIAFLASSWFTAKGMLEKSIEASVMTTEGSLTSVIAAVVAAVLIGTGTMGLFSLAMSAKKSQKWSILALSIVLLPFILTISTYFSAMGTSGGASLVYFMRDQAVAWENYYQAKTADATSAHSARDTLSSTQTQICHQAKAERDHGALTGSAGTGQTYAAYEAGCQSVTTIIETLAKTETRNADRHREAQALIKSLHNIPKNTDLNVFERQAQFRDAVSALRDIINQSGSENVAGRLSAQLDILEASVLTLDEQTGRFGQRQAHAIANLKAMLGTVADTVRTMLASDEAKITTPQEMIEMGEAVLIYWKRNMPQLMLAVMMDLMMFYFLFQLIVSRKSTEEDGDTTMPFTPEKPTTTHRATVFNHGDHI